jgi:hypothetical protein
MAALEARIRAIEGVDMYDLVQVVKMSLVLNAVVLKKLFVLEFIKYS